MTDQMFTASNFCRIFHIESKKGVDLPRLYFPTINALVRQEKNKEKEIKICKKGYDSLRKNVKSSVFRRHNVNWKNELEMFKSKLDDLNDERKKINEGKSDAINTAMSELSEAAAKSRFEFGLTRTTTQQGRIVYCVDDSAEAFFVAKLLQRNFARQYNVKQSSRHELARRVRDTICTGFPFKLIRTDIRSFYESIDRKILQDRFAENPMVSTRSKHFVKQLFSEYHSLCRSQTGIPRGVGISAYLSEIYLQPVDRRVKQLQGIVMYCRYVDDIVAIFAKPPVGKVVDSYEREIESILSMYGLETHSEKTKSLNFAVMNRHHFDYLGYRFTLKPDKKRKSYLFDISLARSSFHKLNVRLNVTFEEYHRMKQVNSKKAYKEIVARIKFLTGNTRLKGRKSGTLIGIYYNHPLISNLQRFKILDRFLRRKISQTSAVKLKNKLSQYSFENGFKEKVFYNFTTHQIQHITRVWKYVKA